MYHMPVNLTSTSGRMSNGRSGTTLFVAAGGGGDALASLLLFRRLSAGSQVPVVASYSWDRRILDPLPGPRSVADFGGVRQLTPHNVEVTASSRLRAGGQSTLRLLAETTASAHFVLLDPHHGAAGMRWQIEELIHHFSFESVVLVDVGGDLVAIGSEEELRSPLADALTLASLVDLPVPITVAVAGPGLDGELSPSYVRSRCIGLGGSLLTQLNAFDIEPYFSSLAEHPSEATTLLAAAALGITGRAEIRDNADVVSVTEASAQVYVLSGSGALAGNKLAQEFIGTRSLAEAEATTLTVCGRCELDYERQKAATLPSRRPSTAEMQRRLHDYWVSADARGITLATFRRLSEVVKLPRYDADLIRSVAGVRAHRHLALAGQVGKL
jgi:hypothetical protein